MPGHLGQPSSAPVLAHGNESSMGHPGEAAAGSGAGAGRLHGFDMDPEAITAGKALAAAFTPCGDLRPTPEDIARPLSR